MHREQSGNPFGDDAQQLDPRGFSVTVDRDTLYSSWFQLADADHDNKLTGPDAVKFFERSQLPRPVLAKVWALADNARKGYLDQATFAKAMDMISIAQSTGDISADIYRQKSAKPIETPQLAGLEKHNQKLQEEMQAAQNPFTNGTSTSAPTVPHGEPLVQPRGINRTPSNSYTYKGSSQSAGGATYGGGAQSSFVSPGKQTTKEALRRARKPLSMKHCTSIIDGLKTIYFNKIKPLEEAYKFGSFFSSLLTESDFEAKPSVLLLGQYSTGKTTFIKHLLGRDYPGIHIGPEPTTDRFVVVTHALEERRTPGNTLIVQPDQPWQGLAQYGNGFLAKFEAASCANKLLEEVTLVDTPGVLSGEKQRIERTYNFIDVCGWFAARCDLILLLFDPHKLDISDEFKQVISTLRGHDDKVRVVLNKADQVDQQQLMRVYGALMWSLGKVFKSPEVCKVYIGSFNADKPIRTDMNPSGEELFNKEQSDLLQDLFEIPQRSCDRKVNEFVKRVRAAKIHILIMGHLRKKMPAMMGKQKAQEKLLANLQTEFGMVQREYHLPAGDFPDVVRYREILQAYDITAFPKLRESMLKAIEDSLSVDIPSLVRQFDNPYA
ncbi:hypothetical protein ABBQ38_003366 [Trebouxia sp. C0009 RCD-2024]